MTAAASEVHLVESSAFQDAVEALYNERFQSVFRYLDRITGDSDLAEDLAQEAFVRLFQRGALPEDPPAWLASVAMNLLRDHGRQTRRRAELVKTYESDAPLPSPAPEADAGLLVDEARSRARKALDQLSARERSLLLLRHEGYSYRELAKAVGVAETSVGTLLLRATRAFREAVGANVEHRGAGPAGPRSVSRAPTSQSGGAGLELHRDRAAVKQNWSANAPE